VTTHLKLPTLTRGKLAGTTTTPNMSRVHKLTVLASNFKAEALSKLDRQCRQLVLMAKRCGNEINGNFEARTLAEKVKRTASALLEEGSSMYWRILKGGNILIPGVLDALAKMVTAQRDLHTKKRQIARMKSRIQKLTTGWKNTSAKAFMKYIRNDCQAPRAAFPDPENDNKYTCDAKRIEELFIKDWHHVYNRKEGEDPPDWEQFLQLYHDYMPKLGHIDASPFTAEELHAQAKRFPNKSAKGLDGWYPRELRLLPRPAWEDRAVVEELFRTKGQYPSVYLEVPLTMLRKAEGLTPKQHRGISVFVASYRLSSGVWWQRILPALLQWIHPSAFGGLPGKECLEAAWEAQMDMEEAFLNDEENTEINTDYEKFYDTFDPSFFRNLFLHIGMPEPLANMTHFMYTNIKRRFRIGAHLGSPFTSNRGAGQGDTISTIGALAITSVQFFLVQSQHPRVKTGSIIDDRNFRGPRAEVVAAVRTALKFDRIAGLINNLPKFVALSNCKEARKSLRTTLFDGHTIKVATEDTLGGVTIISKRAASCKKQNQRLQACIQTGNITFRTKVEQALKKHAFAVAAITKATYGNLWSLPSKSLLKTARTAAVKLLWGGKRAMRCQEVVLAILSNCIRVDPQSAIIYRALCDTRRIVTNDVTRYERLYRNTILATAQEKPGIQGPANGLLRLAQLSGCQCILENGTICLVSDYTKGKINLFCDEEAFFRRTLKKFLTAKLLGDLANRVNKTDEEDQTPNSRKDMQGITAQIDENAIWHASDKRRLRKYLKTAGSTLTLDEENQDELTEDQRTTKLMALWNRHLSTVLAGAPRYLDRLKHAGIVESDMCSTCNQRCTAEHWVYQCPCNAGAEQRRNDIEAHLQVKASNSYHGPYRSRQLRTLYETSCFRLCGICPAPPEHIHYDAPTSEDEIKDVDNLYQVAAGNTEVSHITQTTLCEDRWISEYNGIQRISIYTDGSCLEPRSETARAGWAVVYGSKHSDMCDYGPLNSAIQTSYRAELRAVAQAIVRCKVPFCIKSDCKSIVDQVNRYIRDKKRPSNLPYMKLWNLIFDILEIMPRDFAQIVWIPGHMDSEDKKRKYQHLLDNGSISIHDIEGNCLVDQFAGKGANLHVIPPEILTYSHDRAELTEMVQQHLVCSWHNWILRAGQEAEDRDATINLHNLSQYDDPWQDAQEELGQGPVRQSHYDQEEEDPFNLGRIDLDDNRIDAETWEIHTTAKIEVSATNPLLSIQQLRVRYPDRVWEDNMTPRLAITAHKTCTASNMKPPKGLSHEDMHAIRFWVQNNEWTALHDDSQRQAESIIGHYQCTFHEMALAIEADTAICLGGPGADWATKARILKNTFRCLHTLSDWRLNGQTKSSNFKQIFDSRILRCVRDVTGVWLFGIGRRPLWKQGAIVEQAITINLFLAKQLLDEQGGIDESTPIKRRGDAFGTGFKLVLKPFKFLRTWKPPHEALLQTTMAQCISRKKARLAEDAMTKLHQEPPVSEPPTTQTSSSSQHSAQIQNIDNTCYFGHPTRTRRRQDLVPNWRGAKHGASLCNACHTLLHREINDPTFALIQNLCPPPPKRRKADLDGPCVFGHTHSSSMNPDGAPKWHAIPDLTTWKGAQAGDVICGACYVKMLRNGRDPRKSDEFLPTIDLTPSADLNPSSTDDMLDTSTDHACDPSNAVFVPSTCNVAPTCSDQPAFSLREDIGILSSLNSAINDANISSSDDHPCTSTDFTDMSNFRDTSPCTKFDVFNVTIDDIWESLIGETGSIDISDVSAAKTSGTSNFFKNLPLPEDSPNPITKMSSSWCDACNHGRSTRCKFVHTGVTCNGSRTSERSNIETMQASSQKEHADVTSTPMINCDGLNVSEPLNNVNEAALAPVCGENVVVDTRRVANDSVGSPRGLFGGAAQLVVDMTTRGGNDGEKRRINSSTVDGFPPPIWPSHLASDPHSCQQNDSNIANHGNLVVPPLSSSIPLVSEASDGLAIKCRKEKHVEINISASIIAPSDSVPNTDQAGFDAFFCNESSNAISPPVDTSNVSSEQDTKHSINPSSEALRLTCRPPTHANYRCPSSAVFSRGNDYDEFSHVAHPCSATQVKPDLSSSHSRCIQRSKNARTDPSSIDHSSDHCANFDQFFAGEAEFHRAIRNAEKRARQHDTVPFFIKRRRLQVSLNGTTPPGRPPE
jgi:ribonuclease HI